MDIKNKEADKKFELAVLEYAKSKNIELFSDEISEIEFSIFNEIKMEIMKNKDIKKKNIENKDDKQFILAILDFAKLKNIVLSDIEIKNLVEKMKSKIDSYFKVNKEIKISEINSMVFVKGGKYKPSFADEVKEVFDLEVGKYPVTQKLYQEIMKINPSRFKGKNKPVERVSWWDALVFCNTLSEKYNLAPVYDLKEIEKGKLRINQLSGKNVSPGKADFKDTEGFRLPTEIEWEWFARGGEIAIKEGTFNYKYSGSNVIDEVAWYGFNYENGSTQDVGLKKANQLGLYDCSGNVCEWCYDAVIVIRRINDSTHEIKDIETGKLYISSPRKTDTYRRLRGGHYRGRKSDCKITNMTWFNSTEKYGDIFGFRIVRTV